jgi:hypothetical protein
MQSCQGVKGWPHKQNVVHTEWKNWKGGLSTSALDVHSTTIHTSQKMETTHASINTQADKQNEINTMECYLALEKEEILTHVTT